MKSCPYCGQANYPAAMECRKCQAPFISHNGTVYCAPRQPAVHPGTAHEVRNNALAAVAIGLLMMVYWGGSGPWPVIDNPALASFRTWAQPLLLYGGGLGYLVGWLLQLV
jgi:hypothetical protein